MRADLAIRPQVGHEIMQGGSALTPAELDIWNGIVSGDTYGHLGESMLTGTVTTIGGTHWGDVDTLALDIRTVTQLRAAQASRPEEVRQTYASWQRGVQRAADEGLFPATVEESATFVPPPEGYRAPDRAGFQDTTGWDDDRIQRLLAGLREF